MTIFKKASEKNVVMMDDTIEAWKLTQAALNNDKSNNVSLVDFNIENFKKVIQQSNIYIANNHSQIYKKPQFAFSFGWSGESVITMMKSNESYQFLIHPKLSYVTSDLFAQITDDKNTACVAKYLTNQKTMEILQNNDFYFSPYANYENVNNIKFKAIYKNYIKLLPSLA